MVYMEHNMDTDDIILLVLAELIAYEQEYCENTPEWKKELQDPSVMDEMEWMTFETLQRRLPAEIEEDHLTRVIKSIDGDLVDIEWDNSAIRGIIITENGAAYFRKRTHR